MTELEKATAELMERLEEITAISEILEAMTADMFKENQKKIDLFYKEA